MAVRSQLLYDPDKPISGFTSFRTNRFIIIQFEFYLTWVQIISMQYERDSNGINQKRQRRACSALSYSKAAVYSFF